jgi:hypothetical protein
MKSVNCSKPGCTPIPYNLIFTTQFNDLITIISWDYLNLSLANEYVGDVTIPTQVTKYNYFFPAGSANQIAVFTSNSIISDWTIT